MSRIFTIVLVLIFCFPAAAQSDTATPITADSADRLHPIGRVGSELPSKLAFSPDGEHIVIGTSEYTLIYRANTLSAQPLTLPISDFKFDDEARLAGQGNYWSLETGLSVGIVPTIRALMPDDAHPTTRIEMVKPDGQIITVDTETPYEVIATAVTSDYTELAVAMHVPELSRDRYNATVYLYDLPDGNLYGIFPQNQWELRNFLS